MTSGISKHVKRKFLGPLSPSLSTCHASDKGGPFSWMVQHLETGSLLQLSAALALHHFSPKQGADLYPAFI